MKTEAFRKGATIYPAAPDGTPDYEHGHTYPSINAAKRESRRLQGAYPGLGIVRVIPLTPKEQHKVWRLRGRFSNGH